MAPFEAAFLAVAAGIRRCFMSVLHLSKALVAHVGFRTGLLVNVRSEMHANVGFLVKRFWQPCCGETLSLTGPLFSLMVACSYVSACNIYIDKHLISSLHCRIIYSCYAIVMYIIADCGFTL